MDTTPTDGLDARKLTVTAADLAKELTPERRAAHEGCYRRGAHQMAALCTELAYQAKTLKDARRILHRAETLAGRLRFLEKNRGNGMLMDCIRQRLHAMKRKGEGSE